VTITGQPKQANVIVMELASNGVLSHYAHKGMPEVIARFYFKQMLEGIEAIHEKGIAHLDIKLENILLDKNYDLKIVDFGLASKADVGM